MTHPTAMASPDEIGNLPTLRLRMLGGFEMVRDGVILPLPPTPKSRSLLAYLILCKQRLVHRETICALLWPDESEAAARKALRTALWRIRSALAVPGGSEEYIYSDAFRVGFTSSLPLWVDLWEFEEVVASLDARMDASIDATDGEAMTRAARLYGGNYAAGVYDDWLTVEQARLHTMHLNLLERIADYHASHRQWLQAIGWAERALAADPLREHLYRTVMNCHMSMGDRPSAMRKFTRCEATLRAELGIEPMEETRRLRDRIRGPLETAAPRFAGQRPAS